MSHLISDGSLKRFAAGTASPRSIAAHLLKGCELCAERLVSLHRPDVSVGAYDEMFTRLEKAIPSTLWPPAAPSPTARKLLAELEAQPESRHELLVRNKSRYHSSDLADLLCESSYSFRFKDPRKMLHDARLAALITEGLLPEEDASHVAVASVRVRCLVQLAHALRVSGDLEPAEQALASARVYLGDAAGNLLLRALFYEGYGSLRSAQFRFQEAIWFNAQAVAIYRDTCRPLELARALVGQAIAHMYAREFEPALSLLLEAIPKTDHDSRLTLAACHAVIRCHIDLGEVEKASLRLVELRPLYEKIGDPILRIREKRLEGRLLIAQGMTSAGIKLLETARADFMRGNLDYDAALTALELGPAYFKLGYWTELRRLLADVLPVLRARKLHDSALTSLLFLERAANQGPTAFK